MKNLVETNSSFNAMAYALDLDCTFESAERFALMVAKHQQTVSAQLRLWVSPALNPTSPEARDVSGNVLDDGMFRITHKLCQVRVSKTGIAVAEAFASLQSILRNAFTALKGGGGNVSVRYMEVKPDAAGDFGKTTIQPTKAFMGSPFAEWSKVGEDGILRIARIAWKQAVRVDILDPITTVNAAPGGENIHPAETAGDNDTVIPHHGEYENGHREPGYTREHVEEIVAKAVQRDRKSRRVRLEERDFLFMVQNCHGEVASMIRVAAMKRFGLIEPVVIPFTAPLPSRKRNSRIVPEHVTS